MLVGKCLLAAAICAVLLILGYRLVDDSGVSSFQDHTHEEMRKETSEVFTANAKAPTGAEAEKVELFFSRLKEASQGEVGLGLEDFITIDGMFDSLVSSGALDDFSVREKTEFRAGMESGMRKASMNGLAAMAYDDFQIKRLEIIDADELLAYVQFIDNQLAVSYKMRFWLLDTDEGLRIYDHEDLELGLRAVKLMGLVTVAMNKSVPDPWAQPLIACIRKLKTLDGSQESYAELKPLVVELRRHNMPLMITRFASGVMAACHISLGDPDMAIQELNDSKKGGYDTPLYHFHLGSARKELGEYQAALNEFETFANEYGWDFDIREHCAECLIGLQRYDEAIDMIRAALDENPSSMASHCLLVICLKPESMAEQAHALAEKSGSAHDIYEYALDYLIVLEDKPRAEALQAVFKKEFPESELHEYYDETIPEIGQHLEVVE